MPRNYLIELDEFQFRVLFTFPGNIITAFSSIGVCYPDGRKRSGLVLCRISKWNQQLRDHHHEQSLGIHAYLRSWLIGK